MNRAAQPNMPRRAAFSLFELQVSGAIMVMLAGGLAGAVYLSARALPRSHASTGESVLDHHVLDRIARDLAYATVIVSNSDNAVTFRVPDRGHDAPGPETVTFSWSGTAGDPLEWTYNAAPAETLLAGVQNFRLVYEVKQTAAAPTLVEGPEFALLDQDAFNSGVMSQFEIRNNNKIAQFFTPPLPVDADSWRITRAVVTLAPVGQAKGTVSFKILGATGNGRPGGAVLDEVLVPESALAADTTYEVVFGNAGGLDTAEGYFISIEHGGGGGSAGMLTIGNSSLASPDTVVYHDDGGGTWQLETAWDFWITVYGRAMIPDLAPPDGPGVLKTVGLVLNSSNDPGKAVRTRVQVLNHPEVAN